MHSRVDSWSSSKIRTQARTAEAEWGKSHFSIMSLEVEWRWGRNNVSVRFQAVKLKERRLRWGTEKKVLGRASRMALSRSKDQSYIEELVPECSSVSRQITPNLANSQHKNPEESLTQSSQHLHQGSH